MKLLLWVIYHIVKVYPLGFLLASGKAMEWDVYYDRDDGFIKSIEFVNPNMGSQFTDIKEEGEK